MLLGFPNLVNSRWEAILETFIIKVGNFSSLTRPMKSNIKKLVISLWAGVIQR